MSHDTFSLKARAVELADGDLGKAKAIYAWLTEGAEVVTGDTTVKVTPPKTEPKAQKEPKAKPADPPKAEAPKAPPETPPADDKPALDYQKDVVPKIADAAAKYGKAALLAVFESQFGASNAKEIPAEKWGALLAAIEKIGGNNG